MAFISKVWSLSFFLPAKQTVGINYISDRFLVRIIDRYTIILHRAYIYSSLNRHAKYHASSTGEEDRHNSKMRGKQCLLKELNHSFWRGEAMIGQKVPYTGERQ